jgi:hypothetical protein
MPLFLKRHYTVFYNTMKVKLLLLAFVAPVLLLAQSPWARKTGGGYAQLSHRFIPEYGTLFGKDGQSITLDHLVSERLFQFYGEYGLSKNTTIVLALPYVFNERGADNPASNLQFAKETTGKVSGLGNTTVSIRHQFVAAKNAMAGTLRVSLPSPTKEVEFADLRGGFDAFTIQPMLSFGKGFNRVYGFAYGSYGFRNNGYSHFINVGTEVGFRLGKIWLSAFSELMYSLENGSRKVAGIDGLTGLYSNNQGWLSVGGKAIWEINHFCGIGVSGTTAAWAQYVPKSPAFDLSVYFKWD